MELTLAPETQRLVEEKLKEGFYQSADELVRAAILSLNELDTGGFDEETQAAIDHAEQQIQTGQFHKWQDVREQVRAMFIKK